MQKRFTLTFINNQKFLLYFLSTFISVITIFLGISIGSLSIPFLSILKTILHEYFHIHFAHPVDQMMANIIIEIRLPRVLLAYFVGAALSISGAALQGLLKNPLADPYTLGVSSGASVGAVLVLFLGIQIPFLGAFTLPLFSILFGFITLFLVLMFAKSVDKLFSIETIILTGIIFSSFLGSLISLMIALTNEELRQIVSWLLGSVSMRGWEYVMMILPFLVIGSFILLLNSRELNALSFGEESAKFLGVNVHTRKLVILLCTSLLTGASVAVSGTIGFVGLVIPHITRILSGPNHRHLLPLSILNGGTFLVLADLIARTIITPRELPIGVITALIGAPVFAIIFLRRNRRK